MALAEEHCGPCTTGTGKLLPEEVESLLTTIPSWKRAGEGAIALTLKFPDFATALVFTNRVGELAETENHHPDLALGWGYVRITLTTHSAGGLTRNDFILASKIDALAH